MKNIWGVVGLCLLSTSVNAALVSRSGGLAYYDTDTNLTWVADANLAKTSGYDADGLMNWTQSVGWIASLNAQNAGLGYLGTNDWRLPTTLQPDPSCGSQFNPGGPYPLQGFGVGCTGSEMGHLFNVDGISSSTPSPFSNVQPGVYWSGTEYAPDTSVAWDFNFHNGNQSFTNKTVAWYAWAVRPGDIALVPVPGAVWLFGSALGVMGWMRRKATA